MDSENHTSIVDALTTILEQYNETNEISPGQITLDFSDVTWSQTVSYNEQNSEISEVIERPQGENATTEEYFRATINMDHSFVLNTDNYKTLAEFKVPKKFRLSNDNPQKIEFAHIGRTEIAHREICPVRDGDVDLVTFEKKMITAKVRVKTFFEGDFVYEELDQRLEIEDLLESAGLLKEDKRNRKYFESTGTMELEIKRRVTEDD